MGDSWSDSVKKRIENTFHRAHLIAGICSSPTLEQVKDLLEHAEALTGKAKTVTGFVSQSQALGEAGEALDGAVEKLNKLVEGGTKLSGDMSAACEISEAVEILNDWNTPNSRVSNQEAAKAFDKLFGGAARYFAKLPFPASAYAQILDGIAKYNFFSSMQQKLDPETRWKAQFDSIEK